MQIYYNAELNNLSKTIPSTTSYQATVTEALIQYLRNASITNGVYENFHEVAAVIRETMITSLAQKSQIQKTNQISSCLLYDCQYIYYHD